MIVASNYYSWAVCLGIEKMPPRIRKQAYAKPKYISRKRGARINKDMANKISDICLKKLKAGDKKMAIYTYLLDRDMLYVRGEIPTIEAFSSFLTRLTVKKINNLAEKGMSRKDIIEELGILPKYQKGKTIATALSKVPR